MCKNPVARKTPKPLEQLRDRITVGHCSSRSEEACISWSKRYWLFPYQEKSPELGDSTPDILHIIYPVLGRFDCSHLQHRNAFDIVRLDAGSLAGMTTNAIPIEFLAVEITEADREPPLQVGAAISGNHKGCPYRRASGNLGQPHRVAPTSERRC